jgi:hypothetical protein
MVTWDEVKGGAGVGYEFKTKDQDFGEWRIGFDSLRSEI